MRGRVLALSVTAWVATALVFALMLGGMNGGRHMGAAVLVGVALQVLGALLLVVLASLTWWVSPGRRRWVAVGVGALGLVGLAVHGLDRWLDGQRRAELDAVSERYHAELERVAALDDAALAAVMRDPATWTRDAHAQAAVGEAWKRRACTASDELVDAVAALPGRRWFGMFLPARACGPARMDAVVSRLLLRDDVFVLPPRDDERVDLAVMFLRVDPSARLLERFIRAGFDVNTSSPALDPLLFHVVNRAYADRVAVASLLRLGADPNARNRAGRNAREELQYDAFNWLGEDWRTAPDAAEMAACMALLETAVRPGVDAGR